LFFCLHFSFFLSSQLFPAVSWSIFTKFGMNLSSCMRFKQTMAIFEKFKTRSQRPIKIEKLSIFRPHGHVFVCYDETVKYFKTK
jgi:hypothetical protein